MDTWSSGGTASNASSGGKLAIPFDQDLLTVITLIMLEDGQITEQEINVGTQVYENITQRTLSRETLARACSKTRITRLRTMNFLEDCRLRREHEEKLLLVQAMFAVAAAEGAISPGRMQSLTGAQEALQLDPSEFQRAISATMDRLSVQ